MSIDYIVRYPDQVDTDSNYPQGKARNKSTPAATDGTPFEEDYINDQWGFFQALLKEANITPSGNADTAINSQYLDAIKFVRNKGLVLTVLQTETDNLTKVVSFTKNTNQTFQVLNVSDSTLATIYLDSEGENPLTQNGVNNKSDTSGVVVFYIENGDYLLVVDGASEKFKVGSFASTIESDTGLTLQQHLDDRNIQGLLAPAENISSLQNKVMLQKLRSDFPEFCVYTPLTGDGQYWHRWLFTNRFNVGNSGATRMINCSLAALNPSTEQGNVAANNITETTASSTTVTKGSVDGVQTGTWVGPATVSGTSDVLYSETVGDVLTYTITGAERIVLRGLMNLNGGEGKVQIFDGGVEIPEVNYLTPADRIVSFLSTGLGITTMHYPIASGLESSKTYTVEVRVHTSNPSGGRIYQAGLLGYNDIAYNEVGYHGLFLEAPLESEDSNAALTSGTSVVYEVTDTTKMAWKFVSASNGGDYTYEVYDDNGTLLEEGDIDGFTSSITKKQALLSSGLPKGTYYFKITVGKTKNTLSSDYRIYDVGAIAYDQTLSGEIGVDSFDNLDMPNVISDPNNGSEYMLIGSGNLELAVGVRRESDAIGTQEFVGGIHAFENTDPITVYVDGVEYDYAGSDNLATVVGSEIKIDFDTTLLFPEDSQPFMDVNYNLSFSQSGYGVKTSKTTIANCVIHNDFDIMFNCPSTAPTNQGLSVGGGFELVAADHNYLINNYDNGGTFINTKQGSVAYSNSEYTALCYYNTPPSYPIEFASGDFNKGNNFSLIQDRTDRTIKFYTRSFSGDETNGVTVPSGLTWVTSKVYRVLKGNLKTLTGL